MMGRRALGIVVAMALTCIAGIVGMLLAAGGWDWLFFVMTALPLAFGLWRRWRLREASFGGPSAGSAARR